jgi:hypothetical protein
LVGITLFVLAGAGCATSPEYIAPLAVSEEGYMSLDCDQLTQQQANLGKELSEAADTQRSVLSVDTLGMIAIGLPISSVTGHDAAEKVARLKGEIQALQRAADAKNCHLTPIDVLPPKPSSSSESGY